MFFRRDLLTLRASNIVISESLKNGNKTHLLLLKLNSLHYCKEYQVEFYERVVAVL